MNKIYMDRRTKEYKISLKGTKILLFDIETSPLVAYVWQKSLYNTNIRSDQVIDDWNMISWAAKWLGDNEVIHGIQTPKQAKNRDDKAVTKGLHDILNQADVVIGHNVKKFDLKAFRSRALYYKLPPLRPFQVIDTLSVARSVFGFTYNSLDWLGEKLGIGNKIDTKLELWKECLRGNKKALDDMLAYNIQDVLLLEDIYYELRPHVKGHPNLNLLMDTTNNCPYCGNDKLTYKGDYHTTSINKYASYQCNKCLGYTRLRK